MDFEEAKAARHPGIRRGREYSERYTTGSDVKRKELEGS